MHICGGAVLLARHSSPKLAGAGRACAAAGHSQECRIRRFRHSMAGSDRLQSGAARCSLSVLLLWYNTACLQVRSPLNGQCFGMAQSVFWAWLLQAVSGLPLSGLWLGYRNPAAWAVLVWSALGPGALAAFLQTQVR